MSYLTKEKRVFYSKALEHIRTCDLPFNLKDEIDWNIDEGLDVYIDEINKNKLVITMYSMKGVVPNFGTKSYLAFCYDKKVEEEIEKKLIPFFEKEFKNEKRMLFSYLKKEPQKKKQNINIPDHLKFINHGNYWDIWSFRLELEGGNLKRHVKFWELLTEQLRKLGLD